jgi:uncharacterized protein with HEPN domain
VNRDRSVYLRHIQDLIERVKAYTAEGEAAFMADPKTQDAVLHNLEIIGQCVKDYGVDELALTHPQVQWHRVAAFRNVLAHQYLGVDVGLVWGIIARDVPALERQVALIVRGMDGA